MDQQTEAELTRWLQQTDGEATDDHSVAQAADAVANMDPAEIERMEQELRDEAHADNAGDERETGDGQKQAASAESGQPSGTDTALPDKNTKAAVNDEQPATTHTDHHVSAASSADHDKRETSAQQQAPPPPSAPSAPSAPPPPSAPSSAAASSSETVPQSQAASARHDDQEDCIFPVRRIRFRAQTRPILCQNRNGPCPLLAICNVLLLRGQMDLPQHMEYVSFDYLTQHLSSILLDRTETAHESVRSQYEFNTTVVMDLLPKLKFGLDVNVGFSSVSKFEFTQELSAFDAFGINLYHGWVADPQEEAFPVVSELSYNQLIELVATARDTNSPASAEAQSSEKLTRAYVAEGWMTQTQSQLTYAGLTELHATLKQEELAVLFRNNHFSLLYRHKHELLTLITDIGFVGTPAVWEVLSNVEGDTFLVDADFRQIGPSSAPSSTDAALAQQLSGAVQGPGGSQAATDAELAMQLQRQEELAYQRQQQQQQHGGQQRQQQAAAHHAQQQQAPPTGQMSDEELARYYQQQEHEAAQREQQHQHQQRQISSDAGQAGVPGYMTDEEYARQLQQQEQLAAQQQAQRRQGPAPAQGRAQQQGQQQERKKSGCLVM